MENNKQMEENLIDKKILLLENKRTGRLFIHVSEPQIQITKFIESPTVIESIIHELLTFNVGAEENEVDYDVFRELNVYVTHAFASPKAYHDYKVSHIVGGLCLNGIYTMIRVLEIKPEFKLLIEDPKFDTKRVNDIWDSYSIAEKEAHKQVIISKRDLHRQKLDELRQKGEDLQKDKDVKQPE